MPNLCTNAMQMQCKLYAKFIHKCNKNVCANFVPDFMRKAYANFVPDFMRKCKANSMPKNLNCSLCFGEFSSSNCYT